MGGWVGGWVCTWSCCCSALSIWTMAAKSFPKLSRREFRLGGWVGEWRNGPVRRVDGWVGGWVGRTLSRWAEAPPRWRRPWRAFCGWMGWVGRVCETHCTAHALQCSFFYVPLGQGQRGERPTHPPTHAHLERPMPAPGMGEREVSRRMPSERAWPLGAVLLLLLGVGGGYFL